MNESVRMSVTGLQLVLDCPLCLWISEKIGSAPSPFAAITVQVDSVIKRFMKRFIGRSDLPSWFPVRGEFLDISKTLRAVDPDNGIVLTGRLDALVRDQEGRYVIIDYKTGKPPEQVPDYYQMQLDGYAYLLEQNGYRPVEGGVLLYFTPDHGDITHDRFPFKITAVRAKVDSSRVPPVLARAKEILDSPTPPPRSDDCDMCVWLEQVGRALSE